MLCELGAHPLTECGIAGIVNQVIGQARFGGLAGRIVNRPDRMPAAAIHVLEEQVSRLVGVLLLLCQHVQQRPAHGGVGLVAIVPFEPLQHRPPPLGLRFAAQFRNLLLADKPLRMLAHSGGDIGPGRRPGRALQSALLVLARAETPPRSGKRLTGSTGLDTEVAHQAAGLADASLAARVTAAVVQEQPDARPQHILPDRRLKHARTVRVAAVARIAPPHRTTGGPVLPEDQFPGLVGRLRRARRRRSHRGGLVERQRPLHAVLRMQRLHKTGQHRQRDITCRFHGLPGPFSSVRGEPADSCNHGCASGRPYRPTKTHLPPSNSDRNRFSCRSASGLLRSS